MVENHCTPHRMNTVMNITANKAKISYKFMLNVEIAKGGGEGGGHNVIHFKFNGIFCEFLHFCIKLCCCLFSSSDNAVNIFICYCAILGTEYHFSTKSHHLQQLILINS